MGYQYKNQWMDQWKRVNDISRQEMKKWNSKSVEQCLQNLEENYFPAQKSTIAKPSTR